MPKFNVTISMGDYDQATVIEGDNIGDAMNKANISMSRLVNHELIEDKRFKVNIRRPAHPGLILLNEYIKPLYPNATIDEAIKIVASHIGKPATYLHTVIFDQNEEAAVDCYLALKLAKAFDTTYEFWLNLQRNYDVWYHLRYNKNWIDIKSLRTDKEK